MYTVYGFPLSADEIIRAETRDEVIDRMAEEAKAELRGMVRDALAPLVSRRDAELRQEALKNAETKRMLGRMETQHHAMLNAPHAAGWDVQISHGFGGLSHAASQYRGAAFAPWR